MVNAVALLLFVLLGSVVNLDVETVVSMGLWTGVIGAIAGVVEWSALRGIVPWAGAWVLISAGAGAVGWPVGVLAGIAVLGPVWGASAGWIGVGLLTGLALVFLQMRQP